MPGPTETLARFVAETPIGSVPEDVKKSALTAVIDGIAVTLGGYREMGEKITSFVKQLGGNPTATVMGSGFRTNAPLAAFANGSLAHALDYDDLNESMGGHPTAPVLPAALAMGESVHATGACVFNAYILGVEAETKLGGALIKSLYTSGWHPTSVLGAIGAAAACSRILGLDADKTRTALGIAGSFACGVKQNFGTSVKPLHIGQAAKTGVTAAMLAQSGWTSAPDILEGDAGFSNLFAGRNTYNLESMIQSLGNPWEFTSPGIKQKKYPCCGSTHSAVEAMLGIVHKTRVPHENVKRIECRVHPRKKHVLVHPRPKTGLEAKFSLEYCIAAALVHSEVRLDCFTDKAASDPVVKKLLPRIEIITDDALPEWAGRIRIETNDGNIHAGNCDELPGISKRRDLSAKFHDCSDYLIGLKRSEKAMDLLYAIEHIEDISDLTRMLSL